MESCLWCFIGFYCFEGMKYLDDATELAVCWLGVEMG
jgi:hypothetical protein